MGRFSELFAQAVRLYGGIRQTARMTTISPSTISRIARGEEADPKTAKVLGPMIGVCPCCDQDWPKE